MTQGYLWGLHWPQIIEGDLADAVAQLSELVSEAEATHDVLCRVLGLTSQAHALAYNGAPSAARAAADAAIEGAAEVGGLYAGIGYGGLAVAALASGDVAAADEAIAAGWQQISLHRGVAAVNTHFVAQVALARGDLIEARRWADQAVSTTAGWHRSHALKTRARVARAQGKPEQAERDLNDALAWWLTPGHSWVSPASSNVSPSWPAKRVATVRLRGFSARRTPSGNEPARSASKSTKPATIRQS